MKPSYRAFLARAAAWFCAAATLLLAALLIAQCADIYRTGTSAANLNEAGLRLRDVYSREIVAWRLGRLAWAFALWLAAFAVAWIARAIGSEPGREALSISPEARLALLQTRLTPTPTMLKEARKRRYIRLGAALVCLLCAAAVGVYVCNPANFASRDLEATMGALLVRATPWIALAFVALLLAAWAEGKSVERALAAAKDAPRREVDPPQARRPFPLWICRAALLAAAALLIGLGIINGGMFDVLVKAINICTECIGLG